MRSSSVKPRWRRRLEKPTLLILSKYNDFATLHDHFHLVQRNDARFALRKRIALVTYAVDFDKLLSPRRTPASDPTITVDPPGDDSIHLKFSPAVRADARTLTAKMDMPTPAVPLRRCGQWPPSRPRSYVSREWRQLIAFDIPWTDLSMNNDITIHFESPQHISISDAAVSCSTIHQTSLICPPISAGYNKHHIEASPHDNTAPSSMPVRSITATARLPRLQSLDIFRGITIAGMILVNNMGDPKYDPARTCVVEWLDADGPDFFPFFVFIMGDGHPVSMSRSALPGDSRFGSAASQFSPARTWRFFLLGEFCYYPARRMQPSPAGFHSLATSRVIAHSFLYAGFIVLLIPWKDRTAITSTLFR